MLATWKPDMWLRLHYAGVILGLCTNQLGCSRDQPLLEPTGFYNERVVAVACGKVNDDRDACTTLIGANGGVFFFRWRSSRGDGAVFFVQRHWYYNDPKRLSALADSLLATYPGAKVRHCVDTVDGEIRVWQWQTLEYQAKLFTGPGVGSVSEFRGVPRPFGTRGWSVGPVLMLTTYDTPADLKARAPC